MDCRSREIAATPSTRYGLPPTRPTSYSWAAAACVDLEQSAASANSSAINQRARSWSCAAVSDEARHCAENVTTAELGHVALPMLVLSEW